MTRYDYPVLVFHLGFMVAISWVFRRFVGSVSDYFRGGGKALWWMVGGSAFMSKIVTLVPGVIIILSALRMSQLPGFNLIGRLTM